MGDQKWVKFCLAANMSEVGSLFKKKKGKKKATTLNLKDGVLPGENQDHM